MEKEILRSGRLVEVMGGKFLLFIRFFIYLLFVSEFAGGQRRLVSKLYSVLAVGIYFFCLALDIFFSIWQQK